MEYVVQFLADQSEKLALQNNSGKFSQNKMNLTYQISSPMVHHAHMFWIILKKLLSLQLYEYEMSILLDWELEDFTLLVL